jgi:hypothetical protein
MQGVLVFASATARDSSITSPQEGQFAYLKDTNVTTYYTGSAWANLDTTGMTNPMTTTGDMVYSSSGSTPARLGIGSTGQVLTVAGGVPSWATAAGSSGAAFRAYASTTQSVTINTFTKIAFGAESFDTDGCFASNDFTPTKAGYYQLNAQINTTGAAGNDYFYIYKNGSAYMIRRTPYSGSGSYSLSDLMYFNGTTDYANVYWYSSAITVQSGTDNSSFSGVWIRS